jgi:short-subunit dehydrogenase
VVRKAARQRNETRLVSRKRRGRLLPRRPNSCSLERLSRGGRALYAASKAFVRNFSEGLHDEHRGTPLSVTCICPGGTETAFHAASGGGDYSWIANASTKSAEFVAHAAIRAMLRGKRTVVPGLFNKLSCFFVRFVTRRFASRLATQVLGKPRFVLPARGVT